LLEKADEIGDIKDDESTPGAAVIYAGKTPVLTLTEDDVAPSGEPSLHVLSAKATERFEGGVRNEQRRSRIATTVFSLSLVVFSGLIAFLLLGRVGELATRVRTFITEHPDRLGGLRLGNIEVLSVAAVRGAISVGVSIFHRISQVAIAYTWLIFGLSLFESTRGYTERLGGLVLQPISALISRIGSALPLLVIVLVATGVVFVLIRFIGLFLESVSRGETRVAWMPSDFARPISAIVRVSIVVLALLVATPLITGSDDGALSRAGLFALFALGLASTPVLASVAAGALVVFGRKLKRGEYVELGPRAGRVVAVSLMEVRLLEREGSELRVPHLMSLFQPTRLVGKLPLTQVDLTVQGTPETAARRVLDAEIRPVGSKVRIQLLSIDSDKASYRVTAEESSSGVLEAAIRRALARIAAGQIPDEDPPRHISVPSIPPPPVSIQMTPDLPTQASQVPPVKEKEKET
jgi:small-conductance mechanosensitive channel